jgi:hypothetical protein
MRKKTNKRVTLRAEVIGKMGLSSITGGAESGICPGSVTCSAQCITVTCTQETRVGCDSVGCGTIRGC